MLPRHFWHFCLRVHQKKVGGRGRKNRATQLRHTKMTPKDPCACTIRVVDFWEGRILSYPCRKNASETLLALLSPCPSKKSRGSWEEKSRYTAPTHQNDTKGPLCMHNSGR